MVDEQQIPDQNSEQPSSTDPWREVGQQFEALGQSLAAAFRTIWEREENRQHAEQIKSGMEQMADEVTQAVKQAAKSTEGQEVRQQVRKAADSAQKAGKEAFDEARPHLVSALRQVNSELQKVIEQWEAKAPETEDAPPEPPVE